MNDDLISTYFYRLNKQVIFCLEFLPLLGEVIPNKLKLFRRKRFVGFHLSFQHLRILFMGRFSFEQVIKFDGGFSRRFKNGFTPVLGAWALNLAFYRLRWSRMTMFF
jgi:hypothetical protein